MPLNRSDRANRFGGVCNKYIKKMKVNKKKLLWLAARIALMAVAFCILMRVGLNPFWSVLALIYWKSLFKVGLALGGLLWFAHWAMN